MRPHKLKGGMWCKNCLKKVPENKFYSGDFIHKENKFISKYNVTDTEKEVLVRKMMRQGTTRQEALKKVNQHCKGLNSMKEKVRERKKENEIEEKKKIEEERKKQINFLKNLGQKANEK